MKGSLYIFLFVVFNLPLYAQYADYYRLTKTVKEGVVSVKVSGGQFIRISGKECFETNMYGVPVGHGSLKYSKTYSDQNKSVYVGSSYWGDNTTFVFNSDKSKLIVVESNGNNYVYKRSTPPAGVTTCSLIRKPKPSGRSSGDGGGFVPTPQPQNPYQPIPPQPTPIQDLVPQPRYEQRTYQCKGCHGKGRVADCDGGVVNFGNEKYCSECGRNVPMCHVHKTCPSCHGKGYYTKMERVD